MAVVSNRTVNRATLERQLLLRRVTMGVPETVAHLVGLQAQAPFPPYTGLWTRLAGFVPEELGRLLVDREVVRIALHRSTVHLVTAADCRALRPVLQPVLDRMLGPARRLAGLDREAVIRYARELVEETPRTGSELGRLLAERWPDREPAALVLLARAGLPLVQLPPRAVWGRSGRTVLTTAESWLGAPLGADPDPAPLVLRYLAAFGPATVADAQKWSGLTRLREVFERLRPRLRVDRDDHGAELFDLPDAPRPDPDVPAPVRFLPEFDNLLLAYADPGRVVADERRAGLLTVNGIVAATVLVDGAVAATWRIDRSAEAATLRVTPFTRFSPAVATEVVEEGTRLLAFAAAGAGTHDVVITAG